MSVLDARRELAAAGTEVLLGHGSPPAQGRVVGDSIEAHQPADRAYRVEADGTIVLVDQSREADDRAKVAVCTAAELSRAIRNHAIDRGFALAPLVLHALAGTAASMAGFEPGSQRHALAATAAILRRVAPGSGAVAAATIRGGALWARAGEPGVDVAESLRSLAGEMEREVQSATEKIGNTLAAQLVVGQHATTEVLAHGDVGPLSGGERGTILGALRILQERSVPLHVYVPEGKPHDVGRRIAAAELRAHGILTTVIPDSAVAHLVGSATLSAIVLPIEAVTTAGFALAPLGALASVTIAAEQHVPAFAVAPSFVLETPIEWSARAGARDGQSYALARDTPVVMDRIRLDSVNVMTEPASAIGSSG
jgi:methylthioribose-1-phosphate isomerase